MDRTVFDPNINAMKFYLFRAQYDFQMLAPTNGEITFVENNGRSGIAYGKCELS